MIPRRFTSLDDPGFGALFTGIRESWYRLETLQHYDVRYEQDDYEAFLRGEPLDTAPGPWEEMIASHAAAGRVMRRVHVIEMPPTDYMRYELAYYHVSTAAGEDVRLIPVRRGEWPAGVARFDYWVFDSRDVWRMDYDSGGRFLCAQRATRLTAYTAMRSWDAAWRQSVPLSDVTEPLNRR